MIDFVEGTVEEIRENYVVINSGSIGFGITITSGAYFMLKDASGPVRVYTYLNVKENGIELYGFFDPDEKEVFRVLLSVNGIGAKAGINILSFIQASKLKQAIAAGNIAALTGVPGLGAKKAQRIIVELKDKFKQFAGEGLAQEPEVDAEYIEVLTKLGFNYNQARKAVAEVLRRDEKAEKEDIIKEALKVLGK